MTLEDAQALIKIFNEMSVLEEGIFWEGISVLPGFLNDRFSEFEWYFLLETGKFEVEECQSKALKKS